MHIFHMKRSHIFPGEISPWFENSFSPMMSNLEEEPLSMTRIVYCDLDDYGDKFVLTADLPGMTKEDIEINILDSEIEITAEHKEESEKIKEGQIKNERSQLRYHRMLTLPDKIKESEVSAKMNNGVLTVTLPKQTPTNISKNKPTSVKVE